MPLKEEPELPDISEELEKLKERVFCPGCGQDLGPVQPVPSLVLCRKCRAWITAHEGEPNTVAEKLPERFSKKKKKFNTVSI